MYPGELKLRKKCDVTHITRVLNARKGPFGALSGAEITNADVLDLEVVVDAVAGPFAALP